MKFKFVFIDCFDTILFRHIHPTMVTKQWAKQVIDKYNLDSITPNELISQRRVFFRESALKNGEVNYGDFISSVYKQYESSIKDSFQSFYHACLKIEQYCEIGCLFQNRRIVRFLEKQKKLGVHVFILSDFYLNKDSIKLFLSSQNIDLTLFDDIIVSCDYNLQKKTGELFDYVLKKFSLDPKEVLMIGDNKKSDYLIPKKRGISSRLLPHFFYKLIRKIKLKTNYNYSKKIRNINSRDCKHFGCPFMEYSQLFSSFTYSLIKETRSFSNVIFLSREGYWLKKLYDEYQTVFINKSLAVRSYYFLASRRSMSSIEMDSLKEIAHLKGIKTLDVLKAVGLDDASIDSTFSDFGISFDSLFNEVATQEFVAFLERQIGKNKEAFKKYVLSFDLNNAAIVDIGWKGTMQKKIEDATGVKFAGFYLGLHGDKENKYQIFKKGLLFDENCFSGYFYFLRVNTQLYEMLAAAPHGSIQTYYLHNGSAKTLERWEDNEKQLFFDLIENWQKISFLQSMGQLSWASSRYSNPRTNAKIVTKASLFANKQRMMFLERLDKGFVWNFGKETKGIKYSTKDAKIHLDILFRPERYFRYFAKLQRKMTRNPILRLFYYVIASCYYFYSWLFYDFKKIVFAKK